MLFRLVEHVDVLREEHHLADVSGQLGGVVGRHDSFRRTNLSHQREDVISGIILLGFLDLRGTHQSDQIVVHNARISVTPGRDNSVIALQQTLHEGSLRIHNRTGGFGVELDRNIRNATRRNVFGDVLFTPAHNSHGNDRFSGRREETGISWRETRRLELRHQLAQRFLVINPAEELPNHAEVFNLVDQGCSREGNQEWVLQARPNGPRHRLNMLGAL